MLSLEPLLNERLRQIDGLLGVYGLPDLAQAESTGKRAPCVYLVFDGYRVLESSANQQLARLETRYLVIVSVKHVAKAADGEPARSASAPWVNAVLDQLLGWKPSRDFTPLALEAAPRIEYVAGHLLFPLAFSSVHVVQGAREAER